MGGWSEAPPARLVGIRAGRMVRGLLRFCVGLGSERNDGARTWPLLAVPICMIEFGVNRGHLLGNCGGINAAGVLAKEFLSGEARLPGVVNEESEVLLDVTGAPMNAQDALAAALLGVAGHGLVGVHIRTGLPGLISCGTCLDTSAHQLNAQFKADRKSAIHEAGNLV
jgi:hypothetical protein